MPLTDNRLSIELYSINMRWIQRLVYSHATQNLRLPYEGNSISKGQYYHNGNALRFVPSISGVPKFKDINYCVTLSKAKGLRRFAAGFSPA
jgi:hypothetical protein